MFFGVVFLGLEIKAIVLSSLWIISARYTVPKWLIKNRDGLIQGRDFAGR